MATTAPRRTPPLTVDEYQIWPRRLRGDRGENGICGALVAPVRSDGEVVGVLGVASNRPGRVFGEAEIELLCRFGELAGVAIDNAVRLAAARRGLAELAQSEARYRTVFEELPGGKTKFTVRWTTHNASPGVVGMLAISLFAGFVATIISSAIAYYGAVATYRFGLDPDNHGIPLLTSLMDLAGTLCLILGTVLFTEILHV